MIITGNIFRNLYPQETINWTHYFELLNTTGIYNFYFSGLSGASDLIFSIKNNKVFSYKNELIDGINQNESINYSGNISKNSFDLYKNNKPLFLNLNRQGSGDIGGFNILTTGSNVNLSSISILGEKPQYYIDKNLIYNSGSIIPINITNSGNYNLVIFSGEIIGNYFNVSGLSNLSIPPLGTNTFYLINNGFFSNDIQQLSLNLYSNIGTENTEIILSSNKYFDDLFYINVTPIPLTIINKTNLTYTLSFGNYLNSNLEISLNYISGFTGNYYVNNIYNRYLDQAPVYGFISGQGNLESSITGLISGYNTLLNQFEYGTGYGIGSKFKIVEDQIVYSQYRTLSSGYGNVNFLSDIIGSGYGVNINYSGYVPFPKGYITGYGYNITGTGYIFNQQKTGTILTGISSILVLWEGSLSGDFTSDEYESLNLISPPKSATGNFTTSISLFGIGYATGERISGKLLGDFGEYNFEPGIYTFSKFYRGQGNAKINQYTDFDPITLNLSTSTITGLIESTGFKTIVLQGCSINLSSTISFTGYPISGTIRNLDSSFVDSLKQVDVLNLLPENSGEFINENSNYQLIYGDARTNISRLGPTISGTGIFDNIFQIPSFTGITFTNESGERVNGWGDTGFFGWKENLDTVTEFKSLLELGGQPNDIYLISGGYNLYNTGDENIVEFSLTGDQNTYFDDLQFYFNSNLPNRVLLAELYQKNYISGRLFSGSGITDFPLYQEEGTPISGNLNILTGKVSGQFYSETGYTRNYYNSPPENIYIINFGTGITKLISSESGGLFWYKNNELYGNQNFYLEPGLLPTGDYILKSKFITNNIQNNEYTPNFITGKIGFTHLTFTGCESNGRAQFKISKLDDYQDYILSGTARLNLLPPNFPSVNPEIYSKGIKWNFWTTESQPDVNLGFHITRDNIFQKPWSGYLVIEKYFLVSDSPYFNINSVDLVTSTSNVIIYDDDSSLNLCTGTINSDEPFLLPVDENDNGLSKIYIPGFGNTDDDGALLGPGFIDTSPPIRPPSSSSSSGPGSPGGGSPGGGSPGDGSPGDGSPGGGSPGGPFFGSSSSSGAIGPSSSSSSSSSLPIPPSLDFGSGGSGGGDDPPLPRPPAGSPDCCLTGRDGAPPGWKEPACNVRLRWDVSCPDPTKGETLSGYKIQIYSLETADWLCFANVKVRVTLEGNGRKLYDNNININAGGKLPDSRIPLNIIFYVTAPKCTKFRLKYSWSWTSEVFHRDPTKELLPNCDGASRLQLLRRPPLGPREDVKSQCECACCPYYSTPSIKYDEPGETCDGGPKEEVEKNCPEGIRKCIWCKCGKCEDYNEKSECPPGEIPTPKKVWCPLEQRFIDCVECEPDPNSNNSGPGNGWDIGDYNNIA